MKFSMRATTIALALAAALSMSPAGAADADKVVFSFAFVGCNRLDKAGVKATGSASSANVGQLLQTIQDLNNTSPPPDLLILAGDVVKAKKSGTKVLKQQLADWTKLVKGQLKHKTQLVAFTGNHELLMSGTDDDDNEVPNPPAYAYWQQAMKPFIAGKDGPKKGGADALADDEQRLSYTFGQHGVLFVVLNTDTMIDATTAGDVPANWLAGKLAAAQQDKKVDHIFVMGHKPLVVPGKTPDSGQSNIRQSQGGTVYGLLNTPDPKHPTEATKVRAYLAAHAHEWNYQPNLGSTFGSGSVPQIIAGNGGSPPEGKWDKDHGYFGYTLVQVWQSGKVSAQSFGRAIPDPYYLQTPAPAPATAQGQAIWLRP